MITTYLDVPGEQTSKSLWRFTVLSSIVAQLHCDLLFFSSVVAQCTCDQMVDSNNKSNQMFWLYVVVHIVLSNICFDLGL